MSRNVVVEISHLLRPDGAGLARRRMLSGLGKLREVHDRLVAEESFWPHLRLPDDDALAAAAQVAAEMGESLAVVGQPSAVAAQRAVVDALGTRSPQIGRAHV